MLFYSHPRTNGRRAIYGVNEPGPTIRGVNRPMPAGYKGHPGDAVYEYYEKREYMEFNVTPQLPANRLTVAEVFAGGGLMAVGLKSAGFDIVWANDFEKAACAAYAHNIGPHIVHADITTIDPDTIPDADIIAGGPPCQDFSVAGNGAGEAGERGKLVWSYLSIIQAKKPKAFIFENVEGLIQKKHRATFDALCAKFDEIGYAVSWKLVNAWHYGVAQKRKRVFIIGVRKDLGFTYVFPEPTPTDFETQTLRDVIGDLPEPYAEGAHTIPKNHSSRDCWTPPSEYTYGQANRVMDMGKPSNTIPAHHNSGQPIHPTDAPRRFTVREALRIQSVPDWYIFEGLGLGAMYKIVGNGVASRVAYLLSTALAEQLKGASNRFGIHYSA